MNKQVNTAKERILAVASILFYEQGYNATGIQQIITESSLSKGAFYTHYKTKDDLGVAYMQKRNHDEITLLKQSIAHVTDPLKRYFYFIAAMKDVMVKTDFRGCAFANMCAEIPEGNHPIRKEAKFHYEAFRTLIKDIVNDVIQSDKQYKHLDVQHVTDHYMTIAVGALTISEIYRDTWPYDHALEQLAHLLN